MSANKKETTLHISGMTCAACANRIEKGLTKLDGVEMATVNLPLEKASISYDPAKLGEKDFEEKIDALGYGVVHEKAELEITGMTCAACVRRVEKALEKVSGVESASVNLATEKASVSFDPGRTTVEDLTKAIEGAGYTASPSAPLRSAPVASAAPMRMIASPSCLNAMEALTVTSSRRPTPPMAGVGRMPWPLVSL